LEPPLADRTMLVRERLLERLEGRWVVPLLVVSAPAGYGKTTLLSQAVATSSPTKIGIDCWLSCGPEHAVASTLGENLCRALEAPTRPTANPSVDDLVAAVVDGIWRQSPRQVALLLDDVQELPPDSEAAKLLASVVARMPTNGHLVMAGRRRPPLPLARLEVEGRIVYVDETDLAFTGAELTDFASLRGVSDVNLEACGGWPALAELLARARREVAREYIAEEVLSELPAARWRDLALLGHLGRFDLELARAVLDHDVDVESLLGGVPLVTVAGTGEWSVHSLWQTLLEGIVTASEVAEARRRAGLAMLSRDRACSAVDLLIDSEAWDEVTDAIRAGPGSRTSTGSS
jgi:LuxR family maltose regulon positive regulatory protein